MDKNKILSILEELEDYIEKNDDLQTYTEGHLFEVIEEIKQELVKDHNERYLKSQFRE